MVIGKAKLTSNKPVKFNRISFTCTCLSMFTGSFYRPVIIVQRCHHDALYSICARSLMLEQLNASTMERVLGSCRTRIVIDVVDGCSGEKVPRLQRRVL